MMQGSKGHNPRGKVYRKGLYMKFLHLADLHLGKTVNEISMTGDQKYMLRQALDLVDEQKIDTVLIAGDVYDKSVPSAEAVELLDGFLFALAQRNLQVFLISGNHDSAERLAFGSRLMADSGIHISPVYDGQIAPIPVENADIFLLPFLKPAHVRRFYPEESITGYTDAVRVAVQNMKLDPSRKNILLAHQFVTGAATCDSEEISVGGSDNVDVSVFAPFDYVALGHIHGPQNIVPDKVRYCGTPLKYSFSESRHHKSVTVVEVEDSVTVRTVPLKPLRDLRKIRGTYEELTAKSYWEQTEREDYLHIILTDEEDIPEAVGRLRAIYPNLMKLSYDNTRTRSDCVIDGAEDIQQKTPVELFEELYALQNNQPMTDVQRTYMLELFESVWEGSQ